jgi:ABC-type branched-subunit amino acid transport system ATPase component/ABC-type branched-subunit amino acid transport system permease subunit
VKPSQGRTSAKRLNTAVPGPRRLTNDGGDRLSDFLKFLLIGTGTGGIYALLALGIVLIYRGSGIVNFAQGALALLGAAIYYELPKSLPRFVVVLIAVAVCAVVGALIQLAVMGPMRHASPIARSVATLAILALISSIAVHRYGSLAKPVRGFLPQTTLHPFSNIFVGADRLIILGIAAVLTVVLWLIYGNTRFGLATTAVAENELAASSLGWSPHLVAMGNWAAGSALAGFAGVLLIPLTGLSANSLTLAVIPALAACLFGSFRSFPLTFLGGITIGVLQSETTRYVRSPGWPTAAPFVVIILVLVLRGGALPLRGHLSERLPRLGTGKPRPGVAVAIIALVCGSIWIFTDNWAAAMTTSLAFGILVLSMVVVTGYCGQLSLAQFALAGLGALFATRMADVWHLPFPLAIIAGVIVTVPIGVLVAVPAVRVRGVNLAVASLGLAAAITAVVLGNPNFTGGAVRGTVVPEPKILGMSFDYTRHIERYTLRVLGLLVLCCWLVSNVRRSRTGRRMIAVRSNERAAASLGVSVVGAKLYAFGLGAGIAALGGIMLAYVNRYINFGQFDVMTSIQLVLYAVLGGVGFVLGGALGAQLAPSGVGEQALGHFESIQHWFPIIAAALLVFTVVANSDGIAAKMAEQRAHVGAKLSRRRKAAPAQQSAPLAAVEIGPVTPKTLAITGMTVRFGGVMALHDVSLTVNPGEVVGLIGPNGAGKTTLLDAVSGFVRMSGGTVMLDGSEINDLSPMQRGRRGIGRTFQSLELFEDLSVGDNLRAASEPRDRVAYFSNLVRKGDRELNAAARSAAAQLEIDDILDADPRELPYATRRLVGIARAVALSPSILLLDEPAAGLDDAGTKRLVEIIRRLARERNIGVLLIEHDVSMVLSVCDRIVALNFGSVIATGTPDEIRRNDAVVSAYLGAENVPADEEPAPPVRSVSA